LSVFCYTEFAVEIPVAGMYIFCFASYLFIIKSPIFYFLFQIVYQ
jgi:uncharacterized membrane protein